MMQLRRCRAALGAVLALQIDSLVRQRGAERQMPRSIVDGNFGPSTTHPTPRYAPSDLPIGGKACSARWRCSISCVPAALVFERARASRVAQASRSEVNADPRDEGHAHDVWSLLFKPHSAKRLKGQTKFERSLDPPPTRMRRAHCESARACAARNRTRRPGRVR